MVNNWIPQCTRIFKANYCLKVYNCQLSLITKKVRLTRVKSVNLKICKHSPYNDVLNIAYKMAIYKAMK